MQLIYSDSISSHMLLRAPSANTATCSRGGTENEQIALFKLNMGSTIIYE